MADWRAEEAVNEATFREMNEWTADDRDAERTGRDMAAYLCECGDSRCTMPINPTRAEYEAIRAVPIRFALAVDHENPEMDHVVYENQRFTAVDKFSGVPANIARATNPRR